MRRFCSVNPITWPMMRKKYTDEQIFTMNFHETTSRSLCKKCEYFEGSKNKSKKVSISGTQQAVKSKLLAWYHIFHQEQASGNEQALSFSTSWTASQDACLLEIMSSPIYQNQLHFIHHAAPRGVLDAANGSPMVSMWRLASCCHVIQQLLFIQTTLSPSSRSDFEGFWSKQQDNSASYTRTSKKMLCHSPQSIDCKVPSKYWERS